MEIRNALLTDADAIAEIHVTAKQVAYLGIVPDRALVPLSVAKQKTSWRERIAKNTSTTLVATKAGNVKGWINFGPSRDLDARSATGEVFAMYVRPEMWRRGVGSALWQFAKIQLQQDGYSEVTLWVLERNDRARHFYEKVGFTLESGTEKALERAGKTIVEVRYRYSHQATATADL